MTSPLQSLWPDDVEQAEVLTPLAILQFQAAELEKKTNGRLRADIETRQAEKSIAYNFDIIAPLLHGYRNRLFRVAHSRDLVYPAYVYSKEFDEFDEDPYRIASTQDEFADAVEVVLHSDNTKSVIQSLLAQSMGKEQSSESKSTN